MKRAATRDPVTWLIVVAALLRVVAALQFDPHKGYDADGHMWYADVLASGRLPRVDTDRNVWASQYPPLFYALAVLLRWVGLGARSGQVVSLVAGVVRLVLADHLFRRFGCPERLRLFAMAILAFLPFAFRIDLFYSNESLASTLAIAALAAAIGDRAVLAGVFLGLGLLTKPTVAAAVPAVSYALLLVPREKALGRRLLGLVAAGAVTAVLVLPWAWPNLRDHHTPFPSAYAMDQNPKWKLPLLARHERTFYLPRWSREERLWPYAIPGLPLSMPSTFHFEAWGDFYNYLTRTEDERFATMKANGRPLAPGMRVTHVFAVYVGLVFLAALVAGVLGAVRRLARREMSHGEVALAIAGVAYGCLTVGFTIAVVHESDGATKATYALGASPILSLWTARAFDRLASRGRAAVIVAGAIVALPGLIALVQRFVF